MQDDSRKIRSYETHLIIFHLVGAYISWLLKTINIKVKFKVQRKQDFYKVIKKKLLILLNNYVTVPNLLQIIFLSPHNYVELFA